MCFCLLSGATIILWTDARIGSVFVHVFAGNMSGPTTCGTQCGLEVVAHADAVAPHAHITLPRTNASTQGCRMCTPLNVHACTHSA